MFPQGLSPGSRIYKEDTTGRWCPQNASGVPVKWVCGMSVCGMGMCGIGMHFITSIWHARLLNVIYLQKHGAVLNDLGQMIVSELCMYWRV